MKGKVWLARRPSSQCRRPPGVHVSALVKLGHSARLAEI